MAAVLAEYLRLNLADDREVRSLEMMVKRMVPCLCLDRIHDVFNEGVRLCVIYVPVTHLADYNIVDCEVTIKPTNSLLFLIDPFFSVHVYP